MMYKMMLVLFHRERGFKASATVVMDEDVGTASSAPLYINCPSIRRYRVIMEDVIIVMTLDKLTASVLRYLRAYVCVEEDDLT
jgi:hypothetical protein